MTGAILSQWYQQAQGQGQGVGVDSIELDWLLQRMSGLDRLALRLGTYQSQGAIALRCSWEELQQLWQRRLRDRVPIQYLVGETSWREFCLRVVPGVLIPRPETEQMVDIAAAVAIARPGLISGHWVDLGTGSGAIAMGLATVLPEAQIHAVDCSERAIAIATQNSTQLQGGGDRIQFYRGSWWQPLAHLQKQVSGMVSNPPYIPTGTLDTLQPEVRHHEPQIALDGGFDGLESIRYLVATAPIYLQSGGFWLIELMAGQASQVVELLQQQGQYQDIQVFRDLAGIERFVGAFRVYSATFVA
ncbi:MAG: peptide chain release factor N(5)-glutamine methyltransferase [Jaaginema sp. PMC 1079.18]|nr:peptide chain release factor N(5)-glutamine methyltransferase [Jaaginema sp. PMC 1080.18]MEC4851538.1 peptide chain release factor N(5)-glutamine methyltransferase [Jaaginema sp. PMC 1079.18]MEC4865752.1 peptide chain release factor N(5)-glutamine methyltransferase [Jaaginema sp. PMC 1078.18]